MTLPRPARRATNGVFAATSPMRRGGTFRDHEGQLTGPDLVADVSARLPGVANVMATVLNVTADIQRFLASSE